VVERHDRRVAQQASLFQLAMASAQGNKKAKKALDNHLKALTRTI
jgi:predicted NBD/HSP70 family sugar kinase